MINSTAPLRYDHEFWKNPQNWIYVGVAAIAIIGLAVILSSYNRSKTEAEIKADVLNALRNSEAPAVTSAERSRVLQSLRISQGSAISGVEKAKVLEALRGGTPTPTQ